MPTMIFVITLIETFALSFLLQSSTIPFLHFLKILTLRFFITILGSLCMVAVEEKKWHFNNKKKPQSLFLQVLSLLLWVCVSNTFIIFIF